jgi:Cu2+-exporting ATPase
MSRGVYSYQIDRGAGAQAPAWAGRTPPGPWSACIHCGLSAFGEKFCCPGCQAAYDIIQNLGLGGFYARRLLDPSQRAPKPEQADRADLVRRVITAPDGTNTLTLAVDGLQCGACVWLIESVLARDPALQSGRVNMTTRRLRLTWHGDPSLAQQFCAGVERIGYRLIPFDAACLSAAADETGRALMRALAIAAFAAGNVMLISLGTWFGVTQNMGPATRDLMHWVSALIAMPAVAYAGMPFFRSAFAALRHGRTNMDVPISIGVSLVTALSLWQTAIGGPHAYFDSAVTLLFFLLIGRVMDHRARQRARATAEQLLVLRAADVAVLQEDGTVRRVRQENVMPGALVLVSAGERVGVDGILRRGTALMDASLVTGEALPETMQPGARVFAGTLNLGEAATIETTATGGATLLAECVRLIEAAEHARGKFVILADRVARRYAPAVHITAITTFLVWWQLLHRPLADCLMTAAAVLIITCPCALALAVPAVQVFAISRLFRAGILLKSPTALERLAQVDTVVFDKTGTLTDPVLGLAGNLPADALRTAASLASNSRHPLCRALVREAGGAIPAAGVTEFAGQGLELADDAGGTIRLGSRAFCDLPADEPAATAPELCLVRAGHQPAIFRFEEHLRPDAHAVIGRLRKSRLAVEILSGDHAQAVAQVAASLGDVAFSSRQSPVDKMRRVETLRRSGRHVLMVGDGLNDGPSLAAADISASPSSAADISQTVADVVFQGAGLGPVATILGVARRSSRLMRQNLALSLGYNAIMLPLAVCGYVTPWLAAAAMSSSSLLVMANSFRAAGGEK